MSRKGIVGPLRLNPQNASIAAAVIAERTDGVDRERTPFASLPAFGRKLSNAVRRRRKNAAQIVLWTVERSEAEAGYRYLMAFSHEDAPDILASMLSLISPVPSLPGRTALAAACLSRWAQGRRRAALDTGHPKQVPLTEKRPKRISNARRKRERRQRSR